MHGAYWHKLIHTIKAHKVRLFYLFGSVNSFDVLAPQTSHGTTKNCNYGRYGQHFNITIVVYLEQYSLLLYIYKISDHGSAGNHESCYSTSSDSQLLLKVRSRKLSFPERASQTKEII